MFKSIFTLAALLAIVFSAGAQITDADKKLLHRYEDSLKMLNGIFIDDPDFGTRKNACYDFIKMISKALKVPNSFLYPFDSVSRIVILYSEDRSFRVFNWVLPYESGEYRYYGAIQKNTPGKTEVYPLYDFSDFMQHAADTITNNERWYGCLYYNLVSVMAGSKTYYTLTGWDGNNMRSNVKVIELLSFDQTGKPIFGSPLFDYGKNFVDYKPGVTRFIIEYKENAAVTLNYDPELMMIVFDHLIPEDPSTKGNFATYIPDGSYEGFEWKNGTWNYVPQVFTTTQKEPPYLNQVDFDKEKKIYQPK